MHAEDSITTSTPGKLVEGAGRRSIESLTERSRAFVTESALLLFASACTNAAGQEPLSLDPGRSFAAAEEMFHSEARWLGADAAISVPLGDERTLWLFGDTFVATSERHVRSESVMVRNSIALQTGLDPTRAELEFHWRANAGGKPASFFEERGETWYWPGGGVRLRSGPLVLYLYALVATPGVGLGFASAGFGIALVDDPGLPVAEWRPRFFAGPTLPFDALPATAVLEKDEHVVALAIRQRGVHAGALVRYPSAALARGDLTGAEWWAGDAGGWIAEAVLGGEGPAFVLDDAGAECSLHWEERTRSFVHVASYGFGASTIGVRTAPALTGPWSAACTVYRPPECDRERPFVYAAKAHVELAGPFPADLVLTYATNSIDFGELFTPEGERALYWPRCVVVSFRK
jgi:hypothetical protein